MPSKDNATDTTGTEAENLIVGKLARVLYSSQTEGAFSKEAWEENRGEFRKQARKMMRAMEKHGLKVVSAV